MDDFLWNIIDLGISNPTINYQRGEIVGLNEPGNFIYRITGPNCNILLAASEIHSAIVSDDRNLFAVLASRNYDIDAGLQDNINPGNFIVVYPYGVRYEEQSSDIIEYKFTNDVVEITTQWSHPLSQIIITKIIILNPITGDFRIRSENRSVRNPIIFQ